MSTDEVNDEINDIEAKLSARWESLRITSDFIFCKVMQDKELVGELIRRILPDIEFEDLKIQKQQAIDIGADIRGVRFDIFVTLPDKRVIDVEMQMLDRESLPKRLRYYSALSDTQVLERGTVYNELPDSYVIIICNFDHFEKGRHIYTFTNICHEDKELELDDGSTRIVLNAKGTMDDVSDKLKAFLDYVAGKNVSNDEYIRKLDDAVTLARANKEWRREYMTLEQRDLENQYIGRKEGIGIGQENGVKSTVWACKRANLSRADAIESVMYGMSVSQKEADELVSKYW